MLDGTKNALVRQQIRIQGLEPLCLREMRYVVGERLGRYGVRRPTLRTVNVIVPNDAQGLEAEARDSTP
jgi:hypothetical protein